MRNAYAYAPSVLDTLANNTISGKKNENIFSSHNNTLIITPAGYRNVKKLFSLYRPAVSSPGIRPKNMAGYRGLTVLLFGTIGET